MLKEPAPFRFLVARTEVTVKHLCKRNQRSSFAEGGGHLGGLFMGEGDKINKKKIMSKRELGAGNVGKIMWSKNSKLIICTPL